MFYKLINKHPELFLAGVLWCICWLVGYVLYILLPISHGKDGFPWIEPAGTNIISFLQYSNTIWDSQHFLRIASSWYSPVDHIGNTDYLFAFFPGYPALVGFFGFFISPQISQYIFSFFLVLVLAFTMHTFFRNYFNQQKSFQYTTISLLLPFSIFFFVPYSEALFSILLITFLILLQSSYQNKTLLLMYLFFLGFGMTITRSVGIVFLIVLGGYLLFDFLRKKYTKHNDLVEIKQKIIKVVVAGCGSIIAMIVFFTHNLILTGEFFISRRIQEYFRDGTPNSLFEPIIRGLQETLSGEQVSRSLLFLPIIFVVFWLVWRWCVLYEPRLKWLAAVGILYSAVLIILNLSANSLMSSNRYILTSPIYLLLLPIYLAENEKFNRYKHIVLFALFALFVFTSAWYFNHRWLG